MLAAATLGLGCTTVHMVKRDGCWVRHTHAFPHQVKEEVGVCTRKPPVWSKDRVTRLVQECMAEADFRWQNEALQAWNRGKSIPPEPPEHQVMQRCMDDSATALVRQNEALQKRVAALTRQEDALQARADQTLQDLRQNEAQMTTALGKAAERPTPNAYALATSSGTADTKSDHQAKSPVIFPTWMPWAMSDAPAHPHAVHASHASHAAKEKKRALAVPACTVPMDPVKAGAKSADRVPKSVPPSGPDPAAK